MHLPEKGLSMIAQPLSKQIYFFLQSQSLAFLLHPTQTPFLIGFPHFLQGVHPHVSHILIILLSSLFNS